MVREIKFAKECDDCIELERDDNVIDCRGCFIRAQLNDEVKSWKLKQ